MKIEIPTLCPCCSCKLELVTDQLFCRNLACEAQLGKKLEHFCKTLGIKGLGAKTLEKLQLSDITEIFYLDLLTLTNRLGSAKVSEKLFAEITKAKDADLGTVLASFSIPLIGGTAAAKLSQVISNIEDITPELCKKAGLGVKATDNLMSWLNTDFPEMKEFLPFSFKPVNTPVVAANAKRVCITGKLESFKTKLIATQALVDAGFIVTDSVTKQTDYLVDEDSKGSSKRVKADSLGITIIPNLYQFLKDNT